MAAGSYIDLGNPVADHPINRGLVGWWLPLPNSFGGLTLFDIGPHRFKGALTAGPTWSSGPSAFPSLNFDGVDDRVETPSSSFFSGMSALTLSCWINPTATTSASEFMKKNNSWIMRFGAGASLAVFIWVSASLVNTSGGTLTTGKWQHVAMTYDGAALKGWINGLQVCTTAATGTVDANTDVLAFGAQPGGGEQYTGRITDWRVQAAYIPPWDLYQESRMGYPNGLRRYSQRVYSFSPPAAAGGGPWPWFTDNELSGGLQHMGF